MRRNERPVSQHGWTVMPSSETESIMILRGDTPVLT
jgi:hypothetical protein